MVDQNVGVGRMELTREVELLNNILLFHPEWLETIWTGLVGIQYNNYR